METDSSAVLFSIARDCDEWIENLAAEARLIARRFGTEMYRARVYSESTSSWFRYAVKVRFKRGDGRTLHITWNRMTWKKRRGGDHRYFAVHIRKGKGLRYRTRDFDPVSDEERALIEECENEFALIRRDIQVIGKLRRTIAYALKAIEKECETSAATEF